MNWESIVLETSAPEGELPRRIDELFAQQRLGWQTLREGEEALSRMTSKVYRMDGEQVIVQANPGRRQSTYARVDPQSVAKRPCFLCPENMPAEERGVAFEDLVILPNPCPVVPRHCTIPSREHTPQLVTRRIPDMLRLARALGPELLVFYNGPRCGASAPDHFHFQACDASAVPLFSHISAGDPLQALTSFGRRMLVSSADNPGDAGRHLDNILQAWSSMSGGDGEPLVSVLSVYRENRHLTAVFPRAKHRPRCYFADEDSRIAVSPAALEMGGILVVAEPGHFDRVDQQMALSIYQEVSVDEERFAELVQAVT